MNKIKKLEKKSTNIFNAMMDSIAFAIGSYIAISILLKAVIHVLEWIISLPFFMAGNYIYITMDNFAYACGDILDIIGIVIAIVGLIDAFFLGRKYFKIERIIKKHKKRS